MPVWRSVLLTYDFANVPKGTMYEHLYISIRDDIKAGRLSHGEKLPSKRALAKHLGLSTITVESAYAQLISEGYVYSLPKRGYFVARLEGMTKLTPSHHTTATITLPAKKPSYAMDFSHNQTDPASFPFATWKKLLRETINENAPALMEKPPAGGVLELREAISGHLRAFRGLDVAPEQIIVGAGTEYLYSLLIQLFGRDKIYCVENPGYPKVAQIYQAQGVACCFADMDDYGVSVSALNESGAQIAHVGPTHQFPTGITMPVSRRYELLAWASEDDNRYIIEDDYDSEFRLHGKPIPTLQGLDVSGKVVYLNTFTKSLSSTVRISYMVLPPALANRFYNSLAFYSCTVSNFEQYTLARFIKEGYFEKHINRMRLAYARKRALVMEMIEESPLHGRARIIDEDSGLHFLLILDTQKSDSAIKTALAQKGIHAATISEYNVVPTAAREHAIILSFANLDTTLLPQALETLASIL